MALILRNKPPLPLVLQPRILLLKKPLIDRSKLEGLPPELRAQAEAKLAKIDLLQKQNPLQGFWPHSEQQKAFLEAFTPVVAAFAGNRFGKTTSLVVRSLIECLPTSALPRRLQQFKRYEAPVQGWILCPTEEKIYDSLRPAFERWLPQEQLKGGRWDKAWNGERMQLSFLCGSTLSFKTYKQDAATLGGAALHFVGYDEPPPKAHRSECKMRLVDFKGFEMFAMTPIRANTSWIRRDIWRKREAPNITVVKAGIRDNPLLDDEAITEALSVHPEHERRAREFGDFMDLGGLIYPDFDRCVLPDPIDLDFIRGQDIVVGIDPGIRNAGFVWVAFDSDNEAWVFNEGLLQNREARDYAEFIRAENRRLGLSAERIQYVCDPAARSRGQVSATTVMAALSKEGIHATVGQNDHEMGFDQLRTRMQHGRFHVDPRCLGLRDEADDYAAQEPDEGKDDSHLVPVKGNDHRLDALRYACMERVWDPMEEEQAPNQMLGWTPGEDIPAVDKFKTLRPSLPMGFMM